MSTPASCFNDSSTPNIGKASRKHAALERWSGGEAAKRSQTDGPKTPLERLPYDILVKLLSVSLELNLMHTSRTIRGKVSNGLGIDKAFSVGAKTITLVALMSPYSWNDRFTYQRDVGFLDVERSRNTAQQPILQEKIFNSGWFHRPRVVRQLLPQLINISLERITVASKAAETLRDMRKRCPDFLKLGQGRSGEANIFEDISWESTFGYVSS